MCRRRIPFFIGTGHQPCKVEISPKPTLQGWLSSPRQPYKVETYLKFLETITRW